MMDLTKLVEQLAQRKNNHIIFYKDGSIHRKTYPEVYTDIQAAIERLRNAGARAGMRVGILASNSYEWIVYDLALVELRCQSVAFPEQFQNKSLSELAERYDLSLLLISARDHQGEPPECSYVIYLESDDIGCGKVRKQLECRPDSEFEKPSLIFSSGSTGKLKCMVVSRRGTERLLSRYWELYDWKEPDSMLIFLPLSNYQQRLLVYNAFGCPHNIYLVDPPDLMRGLKELRPTSFVAPPIFFEGLERRFHIRSRPKRIARHLVNNIIDFLPDGRIRQWLRRRCYSALHEIVGGSIKFMLTGMAPIRKSAVEFFDRAGIPTYVVYGLTECGTVAANTAERKRLGSVGQPFEEGEITLREEGEIIVRKQYPLTHGYLFVSEETANATYLDNNTVATGDIGRFDEDGFLYLVGRKKEIIITSSGVKIHPELLEAKLNECPDIAQSVVFGTDMPYLAAVISYPEPKSQETEERIRAYINKINRQSTSAEWIGKIVFTNLSFTIANGFLTRNLKLARHKLFECFESELNGNSASS